MCSTAAAAGGCVGPGALSSPTPTRTAAAMAGRRSTVGPLRERGAGTTSARAASLPEASLSSCTVSRWGCRAPGTGRRRAASATSARGRRRRRPGSTSRPGRAEDPIAKRRTPARTSHGTSSGVRPPPARSISATRGSRSARAISSSAPWSSPRVDPAEMTDSRPGSPRTSRHAWSASRASSKPWNSHGHAAELPCTSRHSPRGRSRGRGRGTRRPDHGRPAPGRSRRGRPGGRKWQIGAAQHDVDGQVGLAYDGGDRRRLGRVVPVLGFDAQQQPVGATRSGGLGVARVEHDDVEVGALRGARPLGLGSQWTS